MCCFHVRLLSTRTPRNLAVVVCSIGTLAMEAEKEDKFNFMLEKIMYLVFLTFNDSPLRLTQSTSASARTPQENLARVVNAAPLYFFEKVRQCVRRCKILIYFEVYAPRI